jgi:hypothetical protein
MQFSVPIERVPASFLRKTPPTLPVRHLGEHVATAILRDGSYTFQLFYGDLQKGLKSGDLLLKPRYIDESPPGELSTRRYVAVDIVPKLHADLS